MQIEKRNVGKFEIKKKKKLSSFGQTPAVVLEAESRGFCSLWKSGLAVSRDRIQLEDLDGDLFPA